MKTVQLDLLIFGGGIAGLWTLLCARKAGYSALLLETARLGGIQSIAAQGIIHGGTKYALHGAVSESARAIARMPQTWRDCLQGQGMLDLSSVPLRSAYQYLWSTGRLGSNLASFFASKAMQARVVPVALEEYPSVFRHPDFRGLLYRLDEPVVDTQALLATLARQAKGYCHIYDETQLQALDKHRVRIGAWILRAKKILFAAGLGNARLLARWGLQQPRMQTRPLHMVMVKGHLPPLYAHCLGMSRNPRLTVTQYPRNEKEAIWYLGGQLAESGVERDSLAQLRYARAELQALFPWMDWNNAQWADLRIDRAEVATLDGQRPSDAFLSTEGVMVAWPTKLALAPRLAEQVLAHLQQLGIHPEHRETPTLPWPEPPLATLPWEHARWTNAL